MTITFTDCTQIDITDDFIVDIESGLVTSTEVTASLNCCADLTWTLDTGDITSSTYTVLPASYSETTLLSGVYYFKFKVFYVDGTIKEITGCKFKDCDNEVLCKIIPVISESTYEGDVHIKYYFMTNNTCECVCTEMCELYKGIIEELNLETTTNCTTC